MAARAVSAVILAHDRRDMVELVLGRLAREPLVDEVIVVDSSSDGTAAMARARGARVLQPGNLGAAGRNVGAEAARNELVLMLDDDAHPEPGALDLLVEAFGRNPRLAVATGLVRDVGPDGEVLQDTGPGTFDWFLRAGRHGDPVDGFETFFFAEGASLVRRGPFLAAGGFFAPFFFTLSELDAAMRLAAGGWEVRYFPRASFAHVRVPGPPSELVLRLRVRNQLWHYWLRYPLPMAAPRMAGYLVFDLVECLYRGHPGAWAAGIREAWRGRRRLAPERRPLPRAVIRRVERNRGRMHVALLVAQLSRRIPLTGPRPSAASGRGPRG